MPDFVESVRKFGILQPVLLCQRSAQKPDDYEVLAGRRRVLAAKIVGLQMIPAIVRMGVFYADARASAMTIEAQRHFNPNPVAEYRAVKKLIADGYTRDKISEALGLPSERIDHLLQLGSLPDNILDAVQERKMSVTTAHKMAKLSPTFRDKAVEQFNTNGKLSGSDLSQIKTVRKHESVQDVMKQVAASTSKQPTLREKVEALLRKETKGSPMSIVAWNEAITAVLELLD